MAVAGSGDAVTAWQAEDGSVTRVRAAAAPAGEGYGPAQTVSPPGADSREPQVGLDGGGGALLVWERYDGTRSVVDAAFMPSGAPPGPPFTISDSANAFDPDVAALGDGEFLVTWYRSDGTGSEVRAATWTTAGFGPPQTLSAPGTWAQDPQVASSPNGAAVITWRRRTAGGLAVEAVARAPGGTLGARQTLSAAGASVSAPAVVLAPGGEAIAAWSERAAGVWRVAAATRAAGGAFEAGQALSAPGTGIYGPAVAAGPGGLAVVAWSRSEHGPYRVESATRQGGGPFAAAEALSAPAQNAYGPVAAIGPDGETAIAWYTAEANRFSVQAATRPAGGAFSATQALSAPAENGIEPRVAGSPKALSLVWSAFEGSGFAVRETGFSAAATGEQPEPPATGQQGSPTTLDLRAPLAPISLVDRVAPRITYFAVTPRFTVAPRRGARATRRVRRGGRLRFGLSEPAHVTVEISGRGGSAWGTLGPGYARMGDNVIRFSGRIGRRALSRGRHRATILAVDAAGNRSVQRSDTFMISKRARKR